MPCRTPASRLAIQLLGVIALAAVAPRLAAQPGAAPSAAAPARLEFTNVSSAARAAFQAGVGEMTMGRALAAVPHLAEAIRLDEGFGLARAVHALYATMPMADRTREFDRAVADALRGGTADATLALALRAARLSDAAQAPELFRAAKAYFPGDSIVAWMAAFLPGASAGTTVSHLAVTAQAFAETYPGWAAAHLQLATALNAAGDRSGALGAIERAIELAPSAPQPHFTYGNLLRAEGRYDEALTHYRHSVERGGTAATARTQVATTYQLQGRGGAARQEFATALAEATTPAARVTAHRLTGISHALDGNLPQAQAAHSAAFAAAADSALAAARGIVHREVAMFSALSGDRRGVASRLAADSAPSAASVAQHAMIFAAAGMNSEASAAADSALRQAGASPNALVRSRVALARALVQVNARNGDAALEQTGQAGSSPMVYAVRALAEQLRGQAAAARVNRDRVVGWPNFLMANLEHVMARRLVERQR